MDKPFWDRQSCRILRWWHQQWDENISILAGGYGIRPYGTFSLRRFYLFLSTIYYLLTNLFLHFQDVRGWVRSPAGGQGRPPLQEYTAWTFDLYFDFSSPAYRRSTRQLNLQLFAEGDDKTEQPTPHRLSEARKKGQVMKSQELNAAINMAGMVTFFILIWPYFRDRLFAMLQHYFRALPVEMAYAELPIIPILRLSLFQFMGLILPFLLVAFFLGFMANVMQVGFLVSTEVLKPQLSRLNPVEGFKRILSRRSLFEMVKSILKVVIFALVCYFYLRNELPAMLLLLGQEAWVTANVLGKVLVGLAYRVAALFFILAVIDFIYQRHEFLKNLRMSRRDIKDEYKQMEGDPHVRARLRERQRAMARERSMAQVPEATVVITNPTHLAVALRYNQKEEGAPVLLAKGAGILAQRIREIAQNHQIPIIQNPPVARLLYREVEIGEEIPGNLYQAVAEILALVYRLQEKERLRRRRAGA